MCGYKLERGCISDSVWTPNPIDIVVRSEFKIDNKVIAGEFLGIALEKYGHVCCVHSAPIDSSIRIKKQIPSNTWVKICDIGETPITNVYFPIGLYPMNTYEANGSIMPNGSLNIWSEKEIPIGVELHINATFICQ